MTTSLLILVLLFLFLSWAVERSFYYYDCDHFDRNDCFFLGGENEETREM